MLGIICSINFFSSCACLRSVCWFRYICNPGNKHLSRLLLSCTVVGRARSCAFHLHFLFQLHQWAMIWLKLKAFCLNLSCYHPAEREKWGRDGAKGLIKHLIFSTHFQLYSSFTFYVPFYFLFQTEKETTKVLIHLAWGAGKRLMNINGLSEKLAGEK